MRAGQGPAWERAGDCALRGAPHEGLLRRPRRRRPEDPGGRRGHLRDEGPHAGQLIQLVEVDFEVVALTSD